MPEGTIDRRTVRVLLVQCCNLPQWIHVWRKLEALHPDWQIEGLALDHPQTRYFATRLLSDRVVHFEQTPSDDTHFEKVVLPLLNRGYWRIKWRTRDLPGDHLSVDYDGILSPLSRIALARSLWAPLHQPTEPFVRYLQAFPHRPLHGRVLFVESASQHHVRNARTEVDRLLQEDSELIRVTRDNLDRERPELRRRRFDWVILFLTGETGYARLKLLSLRLLGKRMLIVDENGTFHSARPRELAAFLLRRLRHGVGYRNRSVRILFIQTETPHQVRAALKASRQPHLFPRARILLVCRAADRAAFSDVEGVEQCIVLRPRPGIRELWRLWREIERFDPEIQCALFTGRPFFRLQKLLYFALAGRQNFAFNARLDGYWLRPSTLVRIGRREPLLLRDPGPSQKLLLIQTETPKYVRAAAEALRRPELAPDAELSVFCREQDRAEFEDLVPPERLHTYRRKQTLRSLWSLRRRLADQDFDVKAGVFTGRPTFRPAKLLFFLAPGRSRLIFNAGLDAYWLSPRNLPRLLRRETLLFPAEDDAGTRVILIQTEVPAYIEAAHDRLVRPGLYPGARILLFCHEKDRAALEPLQGIETVRTFRGRSSWRELLEHWRHLRRFKPQVVCAVFTGRPIFRKAKWLALAVACRRLLIMNAGLDFYWLRPSTLRRPFRREPLLFGEERTAASETLLIETEAIEEMQRAIRILAEPHVVPDARITVFCHENRTEEYARLPRVAQVVTYGDSTSRNVRLILHLLRRRPDIVAGVFSGRRIFLKQKLLFWLVRARNRLAFNRALDCRYLSWRDVSVLLNDRGSSVTAFRRSARLFAKGLLFAPRFAYLLIWASFAARGRERIRRSDYDPGPGSREA